MPQPGGLVGERSDQFWMCMSERIDGDSGCEIEVAIALLAEQVCALTTHEADVFAGVGRQHGGNHNGAPCGWRSLSRDWAGGALSIASRRWSSRRICPRGPAAESPDTAITKLTPTSLSN